MTEENKRIPHLPREGELLHGIPIHDERGLFPTGLANIFTGYSYITYFREGGTRLVYIGEFGAEARVIKIDKPKSAIASPRSRRHVERGYSTRSDIETLLSIPRPNEHHIVRLLDVKQIPERPGEFISIEEWFSSNSLEDIVKGMNSRGERISKHAFSTIFDHVLDASCYLVEQCGIFHRDIKPSNILVRERYGLEARITDLANACKVNATEAKYLPTAGSHFVMDPRLIAAFTGEERKYDVQSEIYSIGMSMLFALTGKYPVEYDPDTETARVTATGENLLNAEGRLNRELHRSTLEDTLRTLAKDMRRFSPIIRRCVGLGDDSYQSPAELVADFKRASKPTFFERMKALPEKMWNLPPRVKALAGLSIAALGGLTWFGYDYVTQTQQELEEVAAENGKYTVAAGWEEDHLEIVNNLLTLDVFARNHGAVEAMPPQHYPYDVNFLSAKRGDTIIVHASAKQLALPLEMAVATGPFDIAIYIEGFAPANTENAIFGTPLMIERSRLEVSGGFSVDPHMTIPENLLDGTYYIITELSVPTLKSIVPHTIDKKLRFPSPGTVIARKRIPLVVGSPWAKITLSSLNFSGYWNTVHFQNLERDPDLGTMLKSAHFPIPIPLGTKIEMSTPGFEYDILGREYVQRMEKKGNSNDFEFSLDLPRGDTPIEGAILQTVMRSPEGVVLGYSFLPIERKPYDPVSGGCTWKLAMPTADFKKRIIPLARNIRAERRNE